MYSLVSSFVGTVIFCAIFLFMQWKKCGGGGLFKLFKCSGGHFQKVPYHKSEHSTGSSPHSRSLQMSHECFETHLKIKNKNVVLFIIKIMLINIIIIYILIFIIIIINVLYLVWRPPMMPSSSWRESLPRSWPSRRTCWSCWQWWGWAERCRVPRRWHKLGIKRNWCIYMISLDFFLL